MSPRTPLLDPSGYFGREERPSLRRAAGIVTLEAVFTTALVWWFVAQIIARINLSAAERSAIESQIGGMVISRVFVWIFVGWLLVAALFHVFMWFAGADRGFGTTLAVIGEAGMVRIALMPLVAVGFVLLIQQVPSNPDAALEFLQRVIQRDTGVLLLVGFIRTLWLGAVEGVGLAKVHDIALEKTLLVTLGIGILVFLIP